MTMGLRFGTSVQKLAALCVLATATTASAAGRPAIRPSVKNASKSTARPATHAAIKPHAVQAHPTNAHPRKNIKQTEPTPKPKPGAKKAKPAPKPATSKSPKTNPKAKHRKPNPEDEADGDPPVIYRATHDRRSLKELMPQPGRPADPEKSIGEAATRIPATNDDFMRAAGASTALTDTPARGEAHNDEAEKIEVAHTTPAPPRKPAPTPAVLTAAAEPLTPTAAATLHDRARSAATKAETTLKADTAEAKAALTKKPAATKPSIFPEDPADRDAVIEAAMKPQVLPALYTPGGRLIVPPPMKGTHDILVHQNLMATSEGLDRIQDDEDLNRLSAAHLLVELHSSDSLEINQDLPANRRYARPWTAKFVTDTARAYDARFHTPLRLNSAVRTVSYQLRLQRVNGNAAAVDGDGASPHLTGQAIDFGKRGMSVAQIAWMRAFLGPIMDAGKIDVEEEFQQACFHISVYRSYVPTPKPRHAPAATVAQAHAAPIVRANPKPGDDLQ